MDNDNADRVTILDNSDRLQLAELRLSFDRRQSTTLSGRIRFQKAGRSAIRIRRAKNGAEPAKQQR